MSFRKHIYLFILTLVAFAAKSQTSFINQYNYGYYCPSLVETPDHGFALAGGNISQQRIVKTDSAGNYLWNTDLFASPDYTGTVNITGKPNGDLFVMGWKAIAPANNTTNITLTKLNASGAVQWQKFYGWESIFYKPTSLIATSDGGFLMVAYQNQNEEYTYLFKTDGNGDTLWTKKLDLVQIAGTIDEEMYALTELTSGGYFIAGQKHNFGIESGLIAEIDANGNLISTKEYSFMNSFSSIQATADGNFILAGDAYTDLNIDGILVKLDPNYDTLWTNKYGGVNDEHLYNVTETSQNEFIATGSTRSYGAGLEDVYFIKTNQAGDLLDYRSFGTSSMDRGQDIIATHDNGIAICGDYANSSKFCLIKLFSVTPVDICAVTVDSLSTHNIIFWDKPMSSIIDSFKIYREFTTNNYIHIASVAYDSLSEYHDLAANPNATSFMYKISTLDTLGNESALSPFHKTIHLQDLGNGNLQWTYYEIQNQTNPVDFYNFYRDDLGNGNFNLINTFPGSISTYTDPSAASFPGCKYRVDVNWAISCVSTLRLMNNGVKNTTGAINTSRSNIRSPTSFIGVENIEFDSEDISVFPNPAISKLNVDLKKYIGNYTLSIEDVSGRIVLEKENISSSSELTIQDLEQGIYVLKIKTTGIAVSKKLVIAH